MAEIVDKETRARECAALMSNAYLNQALAAIEHGAVEDLFRGGNDADARARIKVVREFKLLLEMAIMDARQAATRPRVA